MGLDGAGVRGTEAAGLGRLTGGVAATCRITCSGIGRGAWAAFVELTVLSLGAGEAGGATRAPCCAAEAPGCHRVVAIAPGAALLGMGDPPADTEGVPLGLVADASGR